MLWRFTGCTWATPRCDASRSLRTANQILSMTSRLSYSCALLPHKILVWGPTVGVIQFLSPELHWIGRMVVDWIGLEGAVLNWNELKWNERDWLELNSIGLNCIEFKWNWLGSALKWITSNWTWIELYYVEWIWIDLYGIDFNLIECNSIELVWLDLNWTALNWTALNWTALNCTELLWINWVGLCWIGLD